jgi:hypothetical protein
MLSPCEEVIWLAALLEGEGSFAFMSARSGSPYITPRISVGMCDQDVVEHVARLLGAKVHVCKGQYGGKPVYRTSSYGLKAIWIMQQVLPYMGERRSAKIQEIFDAWNPAYKRFIKPWPFYNEATAAWNRNGRSKDLDTSSLRSRHFGPSVR